jgi:hypothetical protein
MATHTITLRDQMANMSVADRVAAAREIKAKAKGVAMPKAKATGINIGGKGEGTGKTFTFRLSDENLSAAGVSQAGNVTLGTVYASIPARDVFSGEALKAAGLTGNELVKVTITPYIPLKA